MENIAYIKQILLHSHAPSFLFRFVIVLVLYMPSGFSLPTALQLLNFRTVNCWCGRVAVTCFGERFVSGSVLIEQFSHVRRTDREAWGRWRDHLAKQTNESRQSCSVRFYECIHELSQRDSAGGQSAPNAVYFVDPPLVFDDLFTGVVHLG